MQFNTSTYFLHVFVARMVIKLIKHDFHRNLCPGSCHLNVNVSITLQYGH